MLAIATLVTLALFALVMSQPLFYLVALGRVSGTLSAPAYVELRQALNIAMNRRLPRLYGATVASAAVLLALAVADGAHGLALGALGGIVGLVGDAMLALKRSVPINEVMDGWTTTAYPPDWSTLRARWTRAFALRQWVLCGAFAVLLLGVVVGR